MKIKEIIKRNKEKLKLSTEELSNLSGVPKGTLNKLLRGETEDPRLSTLKGLAKVFNCSLGEFDENEQLKITQEELKLIENYRKLSAEGKEYINKDLEIAKQLYKEQEEFLKKVIILEEHRKKIKPFYKY